MRLNSEHSRGGLRSAALALVAVVSACGGESLTPANAPVAPNADPADQAPSDPRSGRSTPTPPVPTPSGIVATPPPAGAPPTTGGGGPGVGGPSVIGGTVDLVPGGARLLLLGDSITVGLGAPGGYRLPLWSRLQQAGLAYDFVGTETTGSPSTFIDPEHEGHVGWRVADLIQFDGQGLAPDSSIESILAATEPQAVLLHAGTNDMLLYDGWYLAPLALSQLLDRIWAFDPGIEVHVATIVPTIDPSTNLGVAWYRGKVVEVVASKLIAGRPVQLVDMGGSLTPADLALVDGIHPGPAGYQAMADRWLTSLASTDHGFPPFDPGPPVVPNLSANASSILGGHIPSLAVSGVGLVGELHQDEEPGVPLGWRSEPFAQFVGANGIGVPVEAGPRFVVRLPALCDVEAVQIWNGLSATANGQVWFDQESIRSIQVETQGPGGQWIDRGKLTLARGMGRSFAAGERLHVDWPATRAIRLAVLSTYGSVSGTQGSITDSVAISELRVFGLPSE